MGTTIRNTASVYVYCDSFIRETLWSPICEVSLHGGLSQRHFVIAISTVCVLSAMWFQSHSHISFHNHTSPLTSHEASSM